MEPQASVPAESSEEPWFSTFGLIRFGPLARLTISASLAFLCAAMAMFLAFLIMMATGRVTSFTSGPGKIYRVSPPVQLTLICAAGLALLLAGLLFILWRPKWLRGLPALSDEIARRRIIVRAVGTLVLIALLVVGAFWNSRVPLVGGDRRFLFAACGLLDLAIIAFIWVAVVANLERNQPVEIDDLPNRLQCPSCGYYMRGRSELTCPECGRRYTIEQLVGSQQLFG